MCTPRLVVRRFVPIAVGARGRTRTADRRTSLISPRAIYMARVAIGQVIMLVRILIAELLPATASSRAVIHGAAQGHVKFPGRQKVLLSRKWGFTKYSREEFQQRLDNSTLATDGCWTSSTRARTGSCPRSRPSTTKRRGP